MRLVVILFLMTLFTFIILIGISSCGTAFLPLFPPWYFDLVFALGWWGGGGKGALQPVETFNISLKLFMVPLETIELLTF